MVAVSTIDLHCHSNASDGQLPPAAVVELAAQAGVKVLALTDHDTTAGLDAAAEEAQRHGMQLVAGVEISTVWQRREFHVLGLGVDQHAPALQQGLRWNQDRRRQRILAMAERLESRADVAGAVAHVEGLRQAQPGRLHLARYLVEAGRVRTIQQAFDRYLKRGRPAYRGVDWMNLETAAALIRQAGGVAVLAHPLAYGLTGAWMRRVLGAFREAGGAGVEVVVGGADRRRVEQALGYALRTGLEGSIGSDFHGPGPVLSTPGRLSPLPRAVEPVWRRLRDVGGEPLPAC